MKLPKKILDLAKPPSNAVACFQACTLPLPPSTNNLFGSHKGGRHKTKEYKSWIEIAGFEVKRQLRPFEPEAYPLELTITFFAGGDFNLTRDGDNIKPIGDLLVSCGIIASDNLKHVRRWEIDLQPYEKESILGITIQPLA